MLSQYSRHMTYSYYTIDQTTACTIATSLIHCKIDYRNSLLLNYLPATQTNRLQLAYSDARAVTNYISSHRSYSKISLLKAQDI